MRPRRKPPQAAQTSNRHLHVLLASLLCAVVLLLGAYERSLSTSASSSISSRIRVSHRTTACEPEPATTHHHPLLRQHQQHQQQPFSPPAPNNSHLIQPLHSAVGASRTALQAYLNSPSFASEVEQLDQAASARWAAVGQHKSTTPTAAAGATSSQQSNSESNSSSRPTHGVLVVAGGKKLLTHLVVQLKVLRETLGCTLPVEVAWQGGREMDNATLAALQDRFGPLAGFDVQHMPYPTGMRRVPLSRWVGKVAALLHCSFDEVLLLDADNIPLFDPSYLFSDRLYRQHRNLFWPDFWSNWVKPEVYPWLGLNRTVVQPQLRAGAGFTGRDAESGMLLIDRVRWRRVLYWTMWINTWHEQLYYKSIHGDKDTFSLAFVLAGEAEKYRQVSVGPGGVFRWGKDQLEIKATSNTSSSTADGWQLMGALQFDDAGRPAFFHRTMNKMSPDEEPWPAELITGPLPTRWLNYYLAHDSKGPTKGVWWEHVAPSSAFDLLQTNGSVGLDCLYQAGRRAGLPLEFDSDRACACADSRQLTVHASTSKEQQPAAADSAPIPALRVGPGVEQLSQALRVIEASVAALRWLKSADGRTAFPSLAPGSTMA